MYILMRLTIGDETEQTTAAAVDTMLTPASIAKQYTHSSSVPSTLLDASTVAATYPTRIIKPIMLFIRPKKD